MSRCSEQKFSSFRPEFQEDFCPGGGGGTQAYVGEGCSGYFFGSKIWVNLTFRVNHLYSHFLGLLTSCITFFGLKHALYE